MYSHITYWQVINAFTAIEPPLNKKINKQETEHKHNVFAPLDLTPSSGRTVGGGAFTLRRRRVKSVTKRTRCAECNAMEVINRCMVDCEMEFSDDCLRTCNEGTQVSYIHSTSHERAVLLSCDLNHSNR